MMIARQRTSKGKVLDILVELETMVRVMFLQNQGQIAYPENIIAEFARKETLLQRAMEEIECNLQIERKITSLLKMNEQVDEIIANYQHQLQRVDHLLRTAIYYSKIKLKSTKTAQKTPVQPDLIFKFSHQISASHGAVAPEGWIQGDPRRPYPLDAEMRSGYLDHIDDETEEFRTTIYELLKNSLQSGNGNDQLEEKDTSFSSTQSAPPDNSAAVCRDANQRSPSIGWLSSHSNSPPILPTDTVHNVELIKEVEEEEDEDEEEEEDEEESSTSRTSDFLPETSVSTSAVVSPVKGSTAVLLNFDGDESRESVNPKPGPSAISNVVSSDEEIEVTEMMSTDEESSSLSDAS